MQKIFHEFYSTPHFRRPLNHAITKAFSNHNFEIVSAFSEIGFVLVNISFHFFVFCHAAYVKFKICYIFDTGLFPITKLTYP